MQSYLRFKQLQGLAWPLFNVSLDSAHAPFGQKEARIHSWRICLACIGACGLELHGSRPSFALAFRHSSRRSAFFSLFSFFFFFSFAFHPHPQRPLCLVCFCAFRNMSSSNFRRFSLFRLGLGIPTFATSSLVQDDKEGLGLLCETRACVPLSCWPCEIEWCNATSNTHSQTPSVLAQALISWLK